MSESYIVIDTNIWVYRTQLLTIPIGAALLYAARQTNAKLALPEVVEKELIKHTLIRFREAAENIHEGYRLIETFMGERDDYSVPSEHDVEKRIEGRLLELGALIHRVPFTFDHAKNALSRIMEETPPNGTKNQQFKDSAIWEALLELAVEKPVHFITQDGGFFNDSKKKDVLADNLQAEANGRIQIYSEISQFLDQIDEQIPALDRPGIATKIDAAISERVRKHAENGGYEVVNLDLNNISFYLTEKLNVLAVDFQFSYRIENLSEPSEGHPESALLVVEATTSYLLNEAEVGTVSFSRISAKDENGNNIKGIGAIFMSAGLGVIGRRNVPYSFRDAAKQLKPDEEK